MLAACRPGCGATEKVVVVYFGDDRIDVQAPVRRGDETVGVVGEVLNGAEQEQRIVVYLPDAGALRHGDRYSPFRFDGGTGLRVIAGAGAPLVNGDVVEAGPRRRGVFVDAGLPATAPATSAGAVTPATLRGPTPTARDKYLAAAPGVPLPPWSSVPPRADLHRAGIDPARMNALPPGLADLPADIATRARSLPPGEAGEYLASQLSRVERTCAAALAEAQDRGDRQAITDIRQLRAKTTRMIARMRAQASRSR